MSCITGKKSTSIRLVESPQNGENKMADFELTICHVSASKHRIIMMLVSKPTFSGPANSFLPLPILPWQPYCKHGVSQNSISGGSGFESHLGRLFQTMLVDSFSIVAVLHYKDNITKNTSVKFQLESFRYKESTYK